MQMMWNICPYLSHITRHLQSHAWNNSLNVRHSQFHFKPCCIVCPDGCGCISAHAYYIITIFVIPGRPQWTRCRHVVLHTFMQVCTWEWCVTVGTTKSLSQAIQVLHKHSLRYGECLTMLNFVQWLVCAMIYPILHLIWQKPLLLTDV